MDTRKMIEEEIVRVEKIYNKFGKDNSLTREECMYSLGILAGIFLSQKISDKEYNEYGKKLHSFINQPN